jgi:hypothetical protein
MFFLADPEFVVSGLGEREGSGRQFSGRLQLGTQNRMAGHHGTVTVSSGLVGGGAMNRGYLFGGATGSPSGRLLFPNSVCGCAVAITKCGGIGVVLRRCA